MGRLPKRIAFLYLPHILAESEERRKGNPVVVVSGTSPKAIVLDYSRFLETAGLERGAFVRDIERLSGFVRFETVDYDHLEKAHGEIIRCLERYSPSVETQDPGEYLLDLTGTRRIFGRELDTCGKIITELRHAFGFTAQAGIGSNVLIPRLASMVAEDGGVYDVSPTSEREFIFPLSIGLFGGISPVVIDELVSNYNVRTVEDLSVFSREELTCMFGSEGACLFNYAQGCVRENLIQKASGRVLKRELTVSSESNDDKSVTRQLFAMILDLCTRMREERVIAGRFELAVCYQDNLRYTYRGSFKDPSFFERSLYDQLVIYLNRALKRRTCIKKVTLSFSHFVPSSLQLALFHDSSRMSRLSGAFDLIAKRFGKSLIRYGA
jgi:nucleotidyltransferase/DNA polymerase involved in DNA repair